MTRFQAWIHIGVFEAKAVSFIKIRWVQIRVKLIWGNPDSNHHGSDQSFSGQIDALAENAPPLLTAKPTSGRAISD